MRSILKASRIQVAEQTWQVVTRVDTSQVSKERLQSARESVFTGSPSEKAPERGEVGWLAGAGVDEGDTPWFSVVCVPVSCVCL